MILRSLATLMILASTGLAQIVITDSQPYVDDFESSVSLWTIEAGDWELGTPAQGSWVAPSGARVWMTDLDANYAPGSNSRLISPTFDCSHLSADPVISLRIRHKITDSNDICRFEIDIDDGNGFQAFGVEERNWYSDTLSAFGGGPGFHGNSNRFNRVATLLPGAAGRSNVRVRVKMRSNSNGFEEIGVAIDDVSVSAQTKVSTTQAASYDFDQNSGGFFAEKGDLWECGSPSQSLIAGARSGANVFMTDLDADYGEDRHWRLHSPWYDFSSLSEDPVLSFSLWLQCPELTNLDGFWVTIDTGSGFGFLGTNSDPHWYSGGICASINLYGSSSNWGFTGSNGGWQRFSFPLTGAAGLDSVRIRFEFGSADCNNQRVLHGFGEGAAIDDVLIQGMDCHGTEALGEDLNLEMRTDGNLKQASEVWVNNSSAVPIELFVSSPDGEVVDRDLLIIMEFNSLGASAVSPFPGLCFAADPTLSAVLIGGTIPGLNVPLQLTPGGFSHAFLIPTFLPDARLTLQALVITGDADNGIFASTNPRVLLVSSGC